MSEEQPTMEDQLSTKLNFLGATDLQKLNNFFTGKGSLEDLPEDLREPAVERLLAMNRKIMRENLTQMQGPDSAMNNARLRSTQLAIPI